MKRHPNVPSLVLILAMAAVTLFYVLSLSSSSSSSSGGSSKQQFTARLGSHLTSHTQQAEISERRKISSCPVSEEKMALIARAEPVIQEEPLKPWLTLKRNLENMTYLPDLIDIGENRKRDDRYVYVDVGARNYGSSVGGWFKKKYPRQGHNFSVYAIEADPSFHSGYSKHRDVTLLPFAAWTSDEKLKFAASNGKAVGKGGMGRIQSSTTASSSRKSSGSEDASAVLEVQGFDFAKWLSKTVSCQDYVVMKMDVEGAEFELLPRLVETGGICLIDELFLECHYNRWQKCCPERSSKYTNTYSDCLNLLQNLRNNGVLVHQWW